MSSYNNKNITKQSQKSSSNIVTSNALNENSGKIFNSIKFKHFNIFFKNYFNENLKSQLINYLSEKNNNKSTSIFRNEYLNETLSEKTLSDFNDKKNGLKLQKNNYTTNKKINSIGTLPLYNNNYNNENITKYRSLDKLYLNKNNKSKINNKSSDINSKYFSNISNNISNTPNKNPKLKIDINSINILSQKKNNFCNTLETFANIKNDDKNKNKIQQLPKDAANCLLLFLKKNKKYLQRTSKYHLIYKKYENIIDNIIDNIPEKKNNYENFLGYFKRQPMEGINVLDSAFLTWNNYSSKSEKQRHFHILSELTKLKGYIDKDKNKKIFFIKDFLHKYNIEYNKNQIINFDNFLMNFNVKIYGNFFEPSLGIKEMINKIFIEGEKIAKNKKSNKNNITIPPINLKHNFNKEKNNINSMEEKKQDIESYFQYNKTNQINRNKYQKNLNLSDTNSYLKEMERQKLVDKPNKSYTSNYKLIMSDIKKELNQIETEIIKEKQYKNNFPNLPHKNYQNKMSTFYPNRIKKSDELFITGDNYMDNNYRNSSDKKDFLTPNYKNRRKNNKKATQKIINKLNDMRCFNKVELKDVKRRLKLTEYIMYNKAKHKMKLEELGKDELYEYMKKEDKKD